MTPEQRILPSRIEATFNFLAIVPMSTFWSLKENDEVRAMTCSASMFDSALISLLFIHYRGNVAQWQSRNQK